MTNEQQWLINFYADLVGFPVIISVFQTITSEEKLGLERAVDKARVAFEEIIPSILNRQNIGEDLNVRNNQ